jgi:sugar lactone lactonase YvrE
MNSQTQATHENDVPTYHAELVLDAQALLGECPLWHPIENVLYWVDISGRTLNRFDPTAAAGSARSQSWSTPTEPGCIALAQDGLIVACRDGFYRFDPAHGFHAKIVDAPYDTSCMRFNDGKVDAAGRFWAGAMFEPRTTESASMFVLERGVVREAWGPSSSMGVKVSNGLAFDLARQRVYQSDTPNHVAYCFDFDAPRGIASNRRAFFTKSSDKTALDYSGRPDGAALDADGNYWSAQYEGGRVECYTPAGVKRCIIHVPARRTTMLAFGGIDYRTVYITTAREGASDAEQQAFPHAGGIFALQLPAGDTAGVPEPMYRD